MRNLQFMGSIPVFARSGITVQMWSRRELTETRAAPTEHKPGGPRLSSRNPTGLVLVADLSRNYSRIFLIGERQHSQAECVFTESLHTMSNMSDIVTSKATGSCIETLNSGKSRPFRA